MKYNAILFNIVEQCNIRCRHCGYSDSPRHGQASEAELVEWVKQAVRYGIPEIIFTGGEPFTRYELLRAAVAAVASVSGRSGVFTNCSWAHSADIARTKLAELDSLKSLYLSCDKYHLEWVRVERVINVIAAALDLGMDHIVICITHANETDRSEVEQLFSAYRTRVKFQFTRVIPSDQIRKLVPDVEEQALTLRRENFSTSCFLHTPLVNPTGTLTTCHVGKVETHGDISASPYFLGNLREENLQDAFEHAESNTLYQYIRAFGPRAVAEAAIELGKDAEGTTYVSDCDMCFRLLSDTAVHSRLIEKSNHRAVQNRVFLERLRLYGEGDV